MSENEPYLQELETEVESEREEKYAILVEGMQKIFQGEEPKRVTTWLTDRGISYSEAKETVRDAMFEKRHGGRMAGVTMILQGSGMVAGAGLLYWLSQFVGTFLLPLLMAGAFLVGLGYIAIGIFKTIFNVG